MKNGRYAFIIITICAIAIMGYYLYKSTHNILKLSLCFIIGGALGNFLDRVIEGKVIDFIDFYLGRYHFPTFNFADSFIVIGSFLLMYYVIFVYQDNAVKGEVVK